MRIYEVRVDLTRSYKQYESDKVGVSVQLEEGDDVALAIKMAKAVCLGEEVKEAKGGEKVVVEEKKAPAKKPAAKKEGPAKEGPAKEEPKAEEPAKEEPVKEEPKKKRNTVKKNIAYDRSNDIHKKHLGTVLDEVAPEWRRKHMEKAIAASKQLEGTDFIDTAGEILPSFKDELAKLMA